MFEVPDADAVRVAVGWGVGEQAPVGADDAVEAAAFARQAGQDVPVQAEADLRRAVHAGRAAVVRHHLRAPGLDGRPDGRGAVVVCAARTDPIPAVREVRFPAAPSRAAGDVRDRRGDRARAEPGALEAAYVCPEQRARDVGG